MHVKLIPTEQTRFVTMPLGPQSLAIDNNLLPEIFTAEPRLSRDTSECEAQQGAPRSGEAPLTPYFLHPAAEEVLNTLKNALKGSMLSQL